MSTQSAQASQHTLVVGAGMTGMSVLRHLHGRDQLTLIDTRGPDVLPADFENTLPGVELLLEAAQAQWDTRLQLLFERVDRAVISPGLSDGHWLLQRLDAMDVPTCTDIDLFFEASTAPVIGITGTNGKSTVTSLVAELLNAVQLRSVAGGNLGPAALDLLRQPADVYVLELSSFQLQRAAPVPFRVACILNVCADHLDYHGNMAAYVAAKQRIYGAAAHVVFNREDPLSVPDAVSVPCSSFGLDAPVTQGAGTVEIDAQTCFVLHAAQNVPVQRVLPVSQFPLAGGHNARNAAAALAIVQPLLTDGALTEAQTQGLADALRVYSGLPHRCEPIAVIAGVHYINDSKATNVGATIAAVEGLRGAQGGQLLLLLGGDGKGADFTSLRPAFARGVRAAFVYGADAPALYTALADVVPCHRCATLDAAIEGARRVAQAGDSILLSPACASFDQYANFEARGDAFRARVLELAA